MTRPQLRKETIEDLQAELGEVVIVRGLLASERFALFALREQALGRVNEARAMHAERLATTPKDMPRPKFQPPALTFAEFRDYGRFVTEMLACAVLTTGGAPFDTAEGWELRSDALRDRLQTVVERLSGMNEEDVRKNSTPGQSDGSSSG